MNYRRKDLYSRIQLELLHVYQLAMEKKKRREETNKDVKKLTLPVTVNNGTDRQPNMNLYPLI